MVRKFIIVVLAACFMSGRALSQTAQGETKTATLRPFNNMQVAIEAGSTGVGFDVSTYVHDIVRLRTGFDFMPHFKPTMNFAIEAGRYDSDGNWIESNFDDLAKQLEQFTGYKTDRYVAMKGEPTFWNFKFLVDVFPFRNKHWHVTAGFYAGPSSIAKAYNKTEEMPSLLAVAIYNNIYDKVLSGEPIYGDNVYLDPDLEDKMLAFGRMGIFVGENKEDGSAYMMEPDEDGMVKANIKVNKFRPYIGFGYEGRLVRNNDKYAIGFDCGAMIWGGTPKIITHDGTDLARDVTNIYGGVGDYVEVIKTFKVFPVISLRLSSKLF